MIDACKGLANTDLVFSFFGLWLRLFSSFLSFSSFFLSSLFFYTSSVTALVYLSVTLFSREHAATHGPFIREIRPLDEPHFPPGSSPPGVFFLSDDFHLPFRRYRLFFSDVLSLFLFAWLLGCDFFRLFFPPFAI